MTKVSVTFLGAAGTVTGSKYLVKYKDTSILVDCGVFQGKREWRTRNWTTPDFKLESVDAVILTHAHIDHTGILPRYRNLGLDAPVYCSEASADLLEILLPDMGYLQEQEAKYRQKKGGSRHNPPLALFTEKEARETLELVEPVKFNKEIKIAKDVTATWQRMGHILGAGSINLKIGGKTITFSGDIGRYDVPILVNPKKVDIGDLLLIESTYGDRNHKDYDTASELARIINETYDRKGVLVIPSFAVGRAQLLLYYIRELKEKNLIPDLPVVIDSPMATDATSIYRKHPEDYDEEALKIKTEGRKPFEFSKLALVKEVSASKRLNKVEEPMIIISASGMLMGGRILHHIKNRVTDKKNTILFVGYQPPGGRGALLQRGADSIKLFGDKYPVKAKIETISGLSAHGDKDEMLKWCEACNGNPSRVAVIHGETDSAKSFAQTLNDKFQWNTFCPQYLETIEI